MSKYRKKDVPRLAQMFGALSNPNRLQIFLRLVECSLDGGTCHTDPIPCACVGDLGRDMDLAPSTISHHLKELNRAGLVDMSRNGQKVECRISDETLKYLSSFFTEKCCVKQPDAG